MRKVIVTNIVSLDGYYEGPSKNVMALPMDGAFDAYNLARMKAAGTVLLGHNSYQLFSSFWPQMADNPDASPTHRDFSILYNSIEKVVVSNKMTEKDLSGPWKNSTRIIGNAVYRAIEDLKRANGKDIVIYASRLLWNDLLAHGLIDEIHFVVGNVVLGDGTPTFVGSIVYDDPKTSLQLVDVRPFEGSENHLVQYMVKYRQKQYPIDKK